MAYVIAVGMTIVAILISQSDPELSIILSLLGLLIAYSFGHSRFRK